MMKLAWLLILATNFFFENLPNLSINYTNTLKIKIKRNFSENQKSSLLMGQVQYNILKFFLA